MSKLSEEAAAKKPFAASQPVERDIVVDDVRYAERCAALKRKNFSLPPEVFTLVVSVARYSNATKAFSFLQDVKMTTAGKLVTLCFNTFEGASIAKKYIGEDIGRALQGMEIHWTFDGGFKNPPACERAKQKMTENLSRYAEQRTILSCSCPLCGGK